VKTNHYKKYDNFDDATTDNGAIFISLIGRWFRHNSLTSFESILNFLAGNLHQMNTTIMFFVVGNTENPV
jgi:hypothetical protein